MISVFLSTEVGDPVSAGIRYLTVGRWSHAGFFNHDTGETLSAMLVGGVQWRVQRKRTRYMFLDYPCMKEAFRWAQTQIGKPYDYSAIFGMALHRNWKALDSWYCSELVTAAFDRTEQPLFSVNFSVYRVTPVMLLAPITAREIIL